MKGDCIIIRGKFGFVYQRPDYPYGEHLEKSKRYQYRVDGAPCTRAAAIEVMKHKLARTIIDAIEL